MLAGWKGKTCQGLRAGWQGRKTCQGFPEGMPVAGEPGRVCEREKG